ncbi:4-hydroxybenzoate 3-monooxygenase [Streptomyces ziwulingensis]|uniref:4-hydroxybenzoate 3-monooxygenase n=1 Tax=Streptomyces ziwulingensis TaxID=1045501 RepID=A0ABP9C460_9ACTN
MGIVGAGPAGLVAASVLHDAGVAVCVVERDTRERVEARARAGLVEHRVADYLRRQGLDGGLSAGGVRHGWCEVVSLGQRLRVDYARGSGGFAHRVYPQQSLVRDLIGRLVDRGCPVLFAVAARALAEVGTRPRVLCDGLEVVCDYVLCCDGPQTLADTVLPAHLADAFRYPYDWLTALVRVDRAVEAVVYGVHGDGFAGLMPRTAHVARLYLQVPPGEDTGRGEAGAIRERFARRTAAAASGLPARGEVLETGVLRMRGMVRRRMRRGRVLVAGDAAHVLTPSGAKGLNLAVADAADAARSLLAGCRDRDDTLLRGYSRRRVTEAWQVQGFSDQLLNLLHLPDCHETERPFQLRLRHDRLALLTGTGPQATAFAHWYAGSGRPPDPRGPLAPDDGTPGDTEEAGEAGEAGDPASP